MPFVCVCPPGGWRDQGVDPSLFANSLMKGVREGARGAQCHIGRCHVHGTDPWGWICDEDEEGRDWAPLAGVVHHGIRDPKALMQGAYTQTRKEVPVLPSFQVTNS